MGFLDTLFGNDAADAARAAAADTYRKQQAATADLKAYGDTLPGAYSSLAGAFAPYASAGSDALRRLMGGLGLGTPEDSAAFTSAYRALPGYQAGLDRGIGAVDQSAVSKGTLQSGNTLKGLYKFGSDYEDSRANDYLSKLFGVAGAGQTATAQGVGTAAQGLAGQTATRNTAYQGDYGSAGTVGQGEVAAANAQASALGNLLNLGGNLLGIGIGTNWGSNPTSFTSLMRNTGWASPTQRY